MGKAKQLAQWAVWGSFAVAGLALAGMVPVVRELSRSLPPAERAILLSPLLAGLGISLWNETRLQRLLKANQGKDGELAEACAWVRQPWLAGLGWVLVAGALVAFVMHGFALPVMLFLPLMTVQRLGYQLQ